MSTTNIAMTLSFTSGHLKLLGQENRTFTVAYLFTGEGGFPLKLYEAGVVVDEEWS